MVSGQWSANVVTQDDADNYLKGHKEPAYPQIAHWQLATGHWPLATDQTLDKQTLRGSPVANYLV